MFAYKKIVAMQEPLSPYIATKQKILDLYYLLTHAITDRSLLQYVQYKFPES